MICFNKFKDIISFLTVSDIFKDLITYIKCFLYKNVYRTHSEIKICNITLLLKS